MAFINRVDPANENRTIAFHELSAGMSKVADGVWTKADFKTRFNLDTTDDAQLDQLITHFMGLNVNDRRRFHSLVEREGILWERGRQTKAEFLAALGIM